ncbi:ATP-dependent helicase HrpB [Streptomyces sp. N2-109]|uniref:ATP-dependent helicase HrpB n=1 Tax=Streptomyces gossypii TaxID=2883101 RepID=A0ABT2K2L8_9ACTN|nr:ATP-dependent helicase HrpB [Streptomyces gossypii]MCT2594411.1 ATP-dependent helicase HrpB [Streptomyces gossypii]
MLRTEDLSRLPVAAAVPALRAALDAQGVAVLCAPPGTGKTTLVPLELAGLLGGSGDSPAAAAAGTPPPVHRVLVAEPRRMAARSAARRMAWLLGEEPGASVGFTVRGERVTGPRTRVEVVTTGVLLQRLQRDQELTGVDVVLLDECHERHLDADTALAFLLDVRATLRPDLRIIAASATQDSEAWARLLASGATADADAAPVVRGGGASHPVAVRYAAPPSGVRPSHGTWVDAALLRHVAATVREALRTVPEGDVLCFLPGVGEIARVAGLLGGSGAEVLQLHGRAPAAVQETVLRGTDAGALSRRRVILATSVAESSLTVPGVRIVVDSGLAREPRTDHARGLGSLATVRVSRAAATQRLGRAGREAPGTVFRCWAESEDASRPRFPSPEIAVADLTAFALRTACWGEADASGLALLDPPPAGALAAARETLRAVGALDATGRVTGRGTRMAGMGVHPRLARALLDGAALVGAAPAAEAVALLSEEPPRDYGDDLAEALRAARRGGDAYAARWRAEVRRLRAALGGGGGAGTGTKPARQPDEVLVAGTVAALAYPERVARARSGRSALMVSGTRAELPEGSTLREAGWLAVAVADRPAGAPSARIRLAAAVDEETAHAAAGALHEVRAEVRWDTARGEVVAREVECLGAVELRSKPLRSPDADQVRAAVLDGLRREGLELLHWSEDAVALRRRLAFLRRELGEPWPEMSDEALLAHVGDVLGRARSRARLAGIDAGQLLRGLLPWAGGEAARLGELAPERVTVPSGSRVRVDYAGEQPVLAVKLQELFGWSESPRIADGRVPLLVHLLSPAGRPAAVTADLASFWREGYRSVRAELRGRYPRHPWPEDPATAEPTRRLKARRG